MSLESNGFYEFGGFRLNRVERQLFRGGTAVPIAARSVEVLLALVENAGRVIERAELIKRVWPDADGAEGSLAVTISVLRKTLGDRPDGGPYIETVQRQGYRFAAGVTSSLEGAVPSVEDWGTKAGPIDDVAEKPIETAISLSDIADHNTKRAHEGKSAITSSGTAATRFLRWVSAHRGTLALGVAIALAGVAVVYSLSIWRAAGRRAQVRRLAILPFRHVEAD